MNVDDLLLAMIFGGTVLSVAYLRAQYRARLSYRTAERRDELRLCELYGLRSNPRDSSTGPSRRNTSAPIVQVPRSPDLDAMVVKNALPVRVRCVYRPSIAGQEPSATAFEVGQ
jgi:hypothetical protein